MLLRSKNKNYKNLKIQIFLLNFKGERDEMQSKFSESILEMQQKSGLKYLILEKKISSMREELDVKEAQLHAVVEQGPPKKGEKIK